MVGPSDRKEVAGFRTARVTIVTAGGRFASASRIPHFAFRILNSPFTRGEPPITLVPMFSHVVLFWTDPDNAKATEELIAGAEKHLRGIPGIVTFHVGKMVGSTRPVVEQSYQVGLNVTFANQQAQDDYQVHPKHLEFVDKVLKRVVKKVLVYDFA
jgi:hypothetical protein